MNSNLLRTRLRDLSSDSASVDRVLVNLFLRTNCLTVRCNPALLRLLGLTTKEEQVCNELATLVINDGQRLGIEDLIQLFEHTIPPPERVENGAVYTPQYIRNYIVNHTIGSAGTDGSILVADLSCGCGAFLISCAEAIHSATAQPYTTIIERNLFGLDISSASVRRTVLMLNLQALVHGEDKCIKANVILGNALDFDYRKVFGDANARGGFDIVIGNPPYVRAKHLDIRTKELMKDFVVASVGNPDLYIPFFEVGLRNLRPGGRLGFITVNTFKRSVNARALRQYLAAHRYPVKLFDFGGEQIFPNRSTYTCLVFVEKIRNGVVSFARVVPNQIARGETILQAVRRYDELDHHRGWSLEPDNLRQALRQIESCGRPLGAKHPIRNGIATLKNDVFIFSPAGSDATYHYRVSSGRTFPIERAVCRDIIKPNLLKHETEIAGLTQQVIFPYEPSDHGLRVIQEDRFRSEYPFAYEFLSQHRSELARRDKGNAISYPAWYAFGRNQALLDRGKKLLFPYMADQPRFVFTDHEDLLIYCGYAVFGRDEHQLLVLQRVLTSKVFWFYIRHTSKPYANGYFALAKNYVTGFGVPEFTPEEAHHLIHATDQQWTDEFLAAKYGLSTEILDR
jgi:adenine-specific DNA-methyltransferase